MLSAAAADSPSSSVSPSTGTSAGSTAAARGPAAQAHTAGNGAARGNHQGSIYVQHQLTTGTEKQRELLIPNSSQVEPLLGGTRVPGRFLQPLLCPAAQQCQLVPPCLVPGY